MQTDKWLVAALMGLGFLVGGYVERYVERVRSANLMAQSREEYKSFNCTEEGEWMSCRYRRRMPAESAAP